MRTCATFYRIVGYLALGVISASTQEPTPNQPATTQAAPPVSSAQPSSLPASASQIDLRLPLHPKSVRFAVIGDSGTGGSAQYEIAKEMEAYRPRVGFDFVIMLGDNKIAVCFHLLTNLILGAAARRRSEDHTSE